MNIKAKTALATLLLSFALVGCGGGGGDTPDSGTVVDSGTNINGGTSTEETGGGTITPGTLAGESALALTYINKVLKDARLPEMQIDQRLTLAAESHVKYMNTNNSGGHYEDPSLPGYYAYSPADRALKAGWEDGVGENVNYSGVSLADFSDAGKRLAGGLMGAIYHRFGFFGGWTAVGIGYGTDSDSGALVIDMGGDAGVSGNPAPGVKYFVWPAKGTDYSGLVYSGAESPDPLSDVAENASGNPVSIMFNDSEMDCNSINISSFSLVEDSSGMVEPVIKTMTSDTDPNNHMNSCEFVLFPERVLLSGAGYTATFEYEYQGQTEKASWSFTTDDRWSGYTLITYPVGDSSFTVERGVKYLLLTESRKADDNVYSLMSAEYNTAIPYTEYTPLHVVEFSGDTGTVVLTVQSSGDKLTFIVN